LESHPLLRGAFFEEEPAEGMAAVAGHDIDLRMAVQQGAFTIHANNAPLEQLAGFEEDLVKFVIPQAAKPQLAHELWCLGVRRSSLFPDLENLAIDLRNDDRMFPRKNEPPAA